MVVVKHILRNTMPDLLTILPKVISVGITSLVVAEVMCGIFGLGGYAIHENLIKVTSLPATCAILACFAVLSHVVIALLRKRLVVQTKEGA
jgi:ABC-type nitrate/sulfonate/bicarbonate transport system permease component